MVYVGGLTVTLHNLWADYAVALQKQKYPKMQQIGDRFGVSNSVDDSYKTAIDQMQRPISRPSPTRSAAKANTWSTLAA